MTDSACSAAAATLARAGGPPLEQALAKLDDPTTSPHGKVMIVEGFNGRLNSYAAAILKGMTAPGKDETTRACATALLSSIPDLDLLQFLIPLTSDSNPQVKFSALLGVASAAMEGSEFRKQLADLYAAPDTNANMKEHIVAVFSKNPYKTDVPILVTAVQDRALNPDVRRDAAIALGRVGDQAAMDALMNIEPAAGAELRTAVDLSIAAIKERSQAEMGEDSVNMTVKLPPAEPAAAP
jgi:HEAT repeat protein